uniref:Putative secreted protein n=1 Tax=Ixodes ricinus TaxID=34613 RepID=A0A6B0UUE5_IXORI
MLPPTSTSLLLLGQLLLVGLLCRLLGQGLQLEEAHPHQPVHRLFGPLELEAVKVRHVGLQVACCQLLGEGRLLPLGGDPFLLPGPADHLGGRRVWGMRSFWRVSRRCFKGTACRGTPVEGPSTTALFWSTTLTMVHSLPRCLPWVR